MTTKLAMHWRPTHWDGHDADIIRDWHPGSVKIINPARDHVALVRAVSPESIILLRDHPLSEQHADMFLDPVATGVRHAQRMNEILRELGADPARTVVTGINEPEVWAVFCLRSHYETG